MSAARFALEVEDAAQALEIAPGDEAVLEEQLSRLIVDGVPGFLILIRDGKSYVQTSISADGYWLEWRDYTERRHWQAVQDGGDWVPRAWVSDALMAFLNQRPFPESVRWKDVTSRFPQAGW